MTNAAIEYTISRAITTVSICKDAMFYWDFQQEAIAIPDRIVALMELVQRDLQDILSEIRKFD